MYEFYSCFSHWKGCKTKRAHVSLARLKMHNAFIGCCSLTVFHHFSILAFVKTTIKLDKRCMHCSHCLWGKVNYNTCFVIFSCCWNGYCILLWQIGYHPDFERSRCLFIVREDGELVDFSYWKCIKGLIRKNYPLYADSFILRHFRKKSRNLWS